MQIRYFILVTAGALAALSAPPASFPQEHDAGEDIVEDVDESLDFYCNKLGLVELRRKDSEQGRFTLVFLAAPGDEDAQVELTHNWDPEEYGEGRNFGHLAYHVDDIYALCQKLMDAGVAINRPPRDGHMAFVRSPDNISIELLQKGDALPPQEPWASMENSGHW